MTCYHKSSFNSYTMNALNLWLFFSHNLFTAQQFCWKKASDYHSHVGRISLLKQSNISIKGVPFKCPNKSLACNNLIYSKEKGHGQGDEQCLSCAPLQQTVNWHRRRQTSMKRKVTDTETSFISLFMPLGLQQSNL